MQDTLRAGVPFKGMAARFLYYVRSCRVLLYPVRVSKILQDNFAWVVILIHNTLQGDITISST